MKRIYVLVEGQTEETFVRELLAPHFLRTNVYVTPILVRTSEGHRGGVTRYAKVRFQLLRLCKQHSTAYVTTMFDLYALPTDFPGKSLPDYPAQGHGWQKAEFLEQSLSADMGQTNLIPYLMVHEFEALLFARPEKFHEVMERDVAARLMAISQQYNSPEDINEGVDTAPSKRIKKAMPSYQKVLHGALVALDVGLQAMRSACPHFDAWLCKLEEL